MGTIEGFAGSSRSHQHNRATVNCSWNRGRCHKRGTVPLSVEPLECRRLLSGVPRNIILLIGDGMGAEQVEAGRYLLDSTGATPLSFETFPYQGDVRTASANSSVTDSAAAATAMATGVKVNNGVVSVALPGDGTDLQTSLEYFGVQEKMTGLVTTAYVTHATPAAFAAHETDRNNVEQIAEDFLNASRPNVMLGGGGNGLTPASATEAGYTVVTTAAEMEGLNVDGQTFVSGQFGNGYLPYEYDGLGDLPTLAAMTSTALGVLDNGTEGFFLVVEGGRIDHAAHDNDLVRMQHEVVAFSAAVQTVVDWVNTNSGWAETLVVVTADHETGGLTYDPGSNPAAVWSTTGHTGANVPIYARGADAHWVRGTLENTDVFALTTAADASASFGLVMLPDTQFYVETDQGGAIFDSQTQWVADHLQSDQLVFVSHMGDIVRSGAAVEMEWVRGDTAMSILDGVIPYSAIAGNHDFDVVQDHTSATKYIEYFGPNRYAGRPWYGGASEDQTSHYQIFSAGGRQFMHLGLEWNPRPQAITWAQDVLDAHPNLPVVFTTHNYLDIGGRTATGTAVFNSLVRMNPQIFMVLCGHVGGENYQVVQNDAGLDVIEVLADYQARVNGGDGWQRLIRFLPDERLVEFQTYSPYREASGQYPYYETDADSQFLIPLDLDQRFNFGPTAHITAPMDNGVNDTDSGVGRVAVDTVQAKFELQLRDVNNDVDDTTVTAQTVVLARNQELLTESVDYTFAYDSSADVITVTPLGESGFGDGNYQILLSSGTARIGDQTGNAMLPTTIDVVIDTSIVEQQTLSFQQDVAGYSGTQDTYLQQDIAYMDRDNGASPSLNVDADDPPLTGLDAQALVCFDGLFGIGAGQIPAGSTVLAAQLDVQVTNAGSPIAVHRMLRDWSESDTWNSLIEGIQTDDVESRSLADIVTGNVWVGKLSIDVTESLADWSLDPARNYGWVMLPTGDDGVDLDASEGTVPPTLTVTFTPPAVTPRAVDDAFSVVQDQTLHVPAPGVLENDMGSGVIAVQDLNPSHGTVVLRSDGSFDYTPEDGFTGPDFFTYYLTDGTTESLPATVVLDVMSPVLEVTAAGETAVYGTPSGDLWATHGSDDVYEVLEEELYAANKKSRLEHHWQFSLASGQDSELVVEAHRQGEGPDGFAFEYSVDGLIWTSALVVNSETDVQQSAPLALEATGNVWVRAIDTDASAKEDIVDRLYVDHLMIRTRSGSPNVRPLAVGDAYETTEDVILTIPAPGVLGNDEDPEGQPLSAQLSMQPSHGIVELFDDGAFVFTPHADYFGSDAFRYVASDGVWQSDPVEVAIQIAAANDVPVALAQSLFTAMDTDLPITLAGTDVDGDVLTCVVVTWPSEGTLTGTGFEWIYTPNMGFVGDDYLEFTVSDGAQTSLPAKVAIQVQELSAATKFFVVDGTAAATFEYDASVSVPARDNWLLDVVPKGATSDTTGTKVWVVDALGSVVVYPTDGSPAVAWNAEGLVAAEGIATDGTHVWIVDGGTKKLMYYENVAAVTPTDAVRPTARVGLGGKASPKGITTDGERIWIVDSVGELQAYTRDGTFLARWPLAAANASPTGVSVDPAQPGRYWVVDDVADAVFQYQVDETGIQFLTQHALDSGNRDPQGIADPLTDQRSKTSQKASLVLPIVPDDRRYGTSTVRDADWADWHKFLPEGAMVDSAQRPVAMVTRWTQRTTDEVFARHGRLSPARPAEDQFSESPGFCATRMWGLDVHRLVAPGSPLGFG